MENTNEYDQPNANDTGEETANDQTVMGVDQPVMDRCR